MACTGHTYDDNLFLIIFCQSYSDFDPLDQWLDDFKIEYLELSDKYFHTLKCIFSLHVFIYLLLQLYVLEIKYWNLAIKVGCKMGAFAFLYVPVGHIMR